MAWPAVLSVVMTSSTEWSTSMVTAFGVSSVICVGVSGSRVERETLTVSPAP